MNKIMPLFLLTSTCFATTTASQFDGEYIHRHSLYMRAENQTVHNIEDLVKIQSNGDKEAQILIETYTHNFHSCQLVGKAQLEGEFLVFKSQVNGALNRGKKAQCVLKISKPTADKTVTVVDQNDYCKLQYCGQQAELGGQFKAKPPVDVQDKN